MTRTRVARLLGVIAVGLALLGLAVTNRGELLGTASAIALPIAIILGFVSLARLK